MPQKRKVRRARDIEKNYPAKQFIQKLRRLADSLENGGRFRISVGGERVDVPADVAISVEHEREGAREELEFQLVWTRPAGPKPRRS